MGREPDQVLDRGVVRPDQRILFVGRFRPVVVGERLHQVAGDEVAVVLDK